jgi:alkaline phosphatase D
MSDDVTATCPFVFGIASGDVTHDSIVLWAKLATPGGKARWYVEPADTAVLAGGDAKPQAGNATADPATGSIHAPVSGLEPGLQYRYWFEAAGSRSDEGLFKTIPVDRAVRFVVISCAKYNSGFFNAYKAVAEMDEIDFVLHLGDYIYEAAQVPTGKQTPGADIGRPMDPLGDCMTRSDYDTRYALYRRDADLLHMHARHAIIATIDDRRPRAERQRLARRRAGARRRKGRPLDRALERGDERLERLDAHVASPREGRSCLARDRPR